MKPQQSSTQPVAIPKGFITVSENSEITQLRVITAEDNAVQRYQALCAYVLLRATTKRAYFVSVHRICSASTENIFI
jgi:hypothetical protein